MNILTIGDVVGEQGCAFVRKHLPNLKKLKKIDLCIANGENSAAGNGITPTSAQSLFDSGVDFITTGNHIYKRREIYEFLDARKDVIRPANLYSENPGAGIGVIDMGSMQVGVINLMGQAFMNIAENPFLCIDALLDRLKNCNVILLDFHAEATSEKRAMGFYLDGRAAVVFGTHTHVQTADEQILPKGTGYITDLGMTGPIDSVLGVTPESSLTWLKNSMPARYEVPDVPCMLSGCIFEVDAKANKCVSAERICIS
ncbi:MAG: TIGR00282 family metallophosphoesterase [Eubacteriales bacterium]